MTVISKEDSKVVIAAIAIRKIGYWSHLIHPNVKRPIGKGWGLEQWGEEKLRETGRRYPTAGLGIALGPKRGPGGAWLADLEIDGEGGADSLATFLGGEVPNTPNWGSARGDHFLMVVDGDRLQRLLVEAGAVEGTDEKGKGAWHLAELPGLELRIGGYKADGSVKQVQSVIPPTVGTDGQKRQWKQTPRIRPASLPEAAYAFLEAAAERKAIQDESASHGDGRAAGPKRIKAKAGQGPVDSYAARALEHECGAVEGQPEGRRNDRLNIAAFNLGQLVGAGALPRPDVERALNESARRAGLGEMETRATICSGIDAGMLKPRDLSGVGKNGSANGDGHHHHNGNGQGDLDARLSKLNRTDTGNGQRLAARFGGSIRFCHPWGKWLHYDGRRWKIDDNASVRRLAKATARRVLNEAAKVDDDDARKKHTAWALESESGARLNSMMTEAAAEEDIPVIPADMDHDPWALNVLNGTIDLRTGELRKHRREDLITRLAPVEFGSDAPAKLWSRTLGKVFADDEAMIKFVQRLFGMSLTGDVSEQVLPIFYGCGANGKSTLLGAMLEILGDDYAMMAPPGLLVMRKGEPHPTERALLHGKRLIVDMESAEGARLNEAWVKQLTGSDQITARRMREDFWKFSPSHKIVMGTNHKPEIRETKNAIWRRVKLVQFDVAIPESEQKKDLPKLLRAEYRGILAWCVRGCLDWLENGLNPPQAVTDATAEYRAEQDALADFFEAECVLNPQISARATALYERYKQREGPEGMTQRAFGRAMTERGFERYQNSVMCYRGIGLRSDGSDFDRVPN